MSHQTTILEQYGASDFVSRVEAALRQAGLGEGVLPWMALAPLDQFHVGGAAATTALAEKLAIKPGAQMLDVGCGLGGPSRHLASVYGCAVTGIDLNPSLVALATMLTQRAGLADKVTHRTEDAIAMPFQAGSFDIVWTQHVAMNIENRSAFYAEMHRVLRPGGLLAMYDVVAGEAGPLHFPAPWARDPAASFLLTPSATRAVLCACGFEIVEWVDATEAGQAWFEAQAAAARDRPERLRPLALPLVMGPDFPIRTANLRRNLLEGRARLLQAVVRRALLQSLVEGGKAAV
jgi:SAM-dependent methyltransferase